MAYGSGGGYKSEDHTWVHCDNCDNLVLIDQVISISDPIVMQRGWDDEFHPKMRSMCNTECAEQYIKKGGKGNGGNSEGSK